MSKLLFLLVVVVLSSYVAAQMLTQEVNESINISSVLENLSEVSEVSEVTEVSEEIEEVEEAEVNITVLENFTEAEVIKEAEINLTLNLTQKNRECQLRYECRPRGDYFYYDCYFDENISDCRCYVGLFSRCNLEASNLSIIAKQTIRERLRIARIKEKLKPITPLFSLAKGVLYNWRTWVLGVMLVLIALIVFYAYNRNTPQNNLRKARSHHKKAQRLYEKGKFEKAEKHYKLAEEYRKRVKEF